MLASRAFRAVAPLLIWSLGAGAAQAQTPTLRTVAAVGEPAPGGGNFAGFNVESLPILAPPNSRGDVAFFATLLRGPGSEGLFLSSPGGPRGGLRKITLEGDAVPGVGTLTGIGKHPLPALNEGRDVAFATTIRRGRETLDAIYGRMGGKLKKIVAQGDQAPAGGAFAGFGAPVLNNKGVVGFAAAVEGRGVPGGIFVVEGDAPRMVVGAGDDSPGGGIFYKFAERVRLNDAALIAFNTQLRDAPTAGGLFLVDRGAPRKLVLIGDAAPGGGTF